VSRPRLGFVGLGWIGRHRLRALRDSGLVDVAALADPDGSALAEAASETGAAVVDAARILDGSLGLDGVVIATPNALHADQSIAALDAGAAVFCQKPLGRTAAETARVCAAAARHDLLLGVDLSYRWTTAMRRARDAVRGGDIGEVYAAELQFHNAYGPDKAWFTDVASSGGGCLLDLGVHLVDLALWVLAEPKVAAVSGRTFSRGRPIPAGAPVVDDHAVVRIDLADGCVVDVRTSWFLHLGRDCSIRAAFHGTSGAVVVENVAGSFYDLRADLHRGTTTQVLAEPPDDWGGRAAVEWAARLAAGERFDAELADPDGGALVRVASVLDVVHGR